MSERPRILATLEGYAVEGGYDQAGGVATCFAPTIALGRHVGPGDADGLWRDYEAVLDAAATLRLDGVRLGVEWARVEPRRGEVDEGALGRYRDAARHAHALGLGVTVCLVDGSWPAWLGLEAWLLPWVEPYAIEHARRVVGALRGDVDGVLAFADPGGIVSAGFREGTAPPWRRGAAADAASAAAQVARIEAALASDDVVGPLLVASSRTVALGAPGDVVREAIASACDEVYLRALVRGRGPRAAATALVAREDDGWRARVPAALADVLG
ncbi:MAG: hypothetical protein KGJ36_03910 [Acidobacteriota bacterium]|nr:hypothetical protein [Acidobacteriota bacterium]